MSMSWDQLLADGDLEGLYRVAAPAIRQYLGQTWPEVDAESIVQETFATLVETAGEYRGGSARHFVFRIALRHVYATAPFHFEPLPAEYR
jgi:DNA-directed RNA polymerase specialized sigma24 family protein